MIYFRIYNPNAPWYYMFALTLLAGFLYTLPHRNGVSLGVDYLIRRKYGDLSGENSPQKPDDRPQP